VKHLVCCGRGAQHHAITCKINNHGALDVEKAEMLAQGSGLLCCGGAAAAGCALAAGGIKEAGERDDKLAFK
jgi:hypothetical protein